MIKIFRHIRRSFLSGNNKSKYLIYAIGEIALVVIGILLALQINNWNEEKKSRSLEGEYYCRFLEDALQDKEQVNELIKVAEDRLAASNQAVRLLQKDNAQKVEVGKQMNRAILAIYTDFTLNNSAFEDLKSGANLNIIKNKEIIKALNNYFNKVEGYLDVIKINSEQVVDIYFSHKDKFANGWVHASMSTGRFLKGMEKDVYDAIPTDTNDYLNPAMKFRLYNESLTYISANARHIELYNYIKDEINLLASLLETKCKL